MPTINSEELRELGYDIITNRIAEAEGKTSAEDKKKIMERISKKDEKNITING